MRVEAPAQLRLFLLAVCVIIINVQSFIPSELLARSRLSSRVFAEYDHNDDVKTVDIFSLDTIRSTLVRQGTFQHDMCEMHEHALFDKKN